RILDIENGAELAAEVGTVSVRHSGQRIAARRSGLVQEHAQHAGLATPAKLDFDHFQPAGGCYPLRNLAYSVKLKCHASNNLQLSAPGKFLCNEKVGLRPLVCFATCLHNSSQFPNIRPMRDKRQTAAHAPLRLRLSKNSPTIKY